MAKRARELSRQEKQVTKREKRDARSEEKTSLPVNHEDALMEEFARLSERYSAKQISGSEYASERERIFGELGLVTDE
jgi:hypothetical protein